MNTAAYIRVSTNGQNTDNQMPDILAYCQEHQWPAPEIYSENESAWRQGHQKELARLLADLRSGKRVYQHLIIWSIDRLSRGGIGEIFGLIHALRQRDCQVVSCKEPWLDSAGPAGDILLAVCAWVAEFESKRRSERTRAGLDRAKREGVTLGRPVGSKDSAKRKRTGYLMRYAK